MARTKKEEEVVYRKIVDSYYCYHCLNREKAPKDKKETKKQKEEREIRNEQLTLICKKVKINGKQQGETEFPYYYDKKPYHKSCLLAYLKDKFQNDNDIVGKYFEEAIETHDKHFRTKITRGSLTKRETENAKEDRIEKEKLINYLMGHYSVSIISKNNLFLINHLADGTSKKFNNIVISYGKLLDMLNFYQSDLMAVYKSKLKKGNAPADGNQRIIYDISVVALRIDDYNEKKKALYNQDSITNNSEEMIDVRKYIRPSENNEVEITKNQKEFEDACKFADDFTKEYDEDIDDFIKDMLDDDKS